MGSGCVASNTSFNQSFSSISDKMVKYTGPAFPQFGICTNDTLYEVEAVILGQIVLFSQGKGITLDSIDLTKCDCFKNKVGCCGASSCQTLECILQAYLDCLCELYTDVQDLKVKVASMFDGPYNVACLKSVTSASKLPAIVQEMILELCQAETDISNLKTQITTLTTGLPTTIGNFLDNAMKSCQTGSMVKTGSGSTLQINFKGFAPVGAVMPYAGSLAYFDSSGLGNPNSPACGWALCNGNNGTVNLIGLVVVGSTGMPGAAPLGGPAFPYNAVGGEYTVALTSASIPSITVSGTVPATTGTVRLWKGGRKHAGTGDNTLTFQQYGFGDGGAAYDAPFSIPATPFSATAVGGGGSVSHNNIQPYRALYYIQRVS